MEDISKKSYDFLESYLNNASPTGFETAGQKLWLDYIKPYVDTTYTDTYGTAVAVINPEAEYKVVIEAHADEIAWYVNYIDSSGYLYVARNGGSDHQIAPSMRVNLHTKNGTVKGVFGHPAIHVRRGKNEAVTLESIFIDVGAESKQEVLDMGIRVGTVATFADDMMMMNDKFIVGRALDNRIGGFMIAEVARMLKENGIKLDYGLYIVNAVQEEIGLRGAQMIANRIQPDVAIITDVCHDTLSPAYNAKKEGEFACGKGAVLTVAPSVQNNLLNLIIDVAEKNDMPYQMAAASSSSGTDTDAFAYAGVGCASALISLPLKYMHTTVETAHKKDVRTVISLMYNVVTSLKSGHDFRYIK
jgi:tetrahedral aminopeptidase